MNNKLKTTIVALTTLTTVNSSFAGQFFVGASANMQRNSSKFTAKKTQNTEVAKTDNAKLKNEITVLENLLQANVKKQGDLAKQLSVTTTNTLNDKKIVDKIKKISLADLTGHTDFENYLTSSLLIGADKINSDIYVDKKDINTDKFLSGIKDIDANLSNIITGKNAIIVLIESDNSAILKDENLKKVNQEINKIYAEELKELAKSKEVQDILAVNLEIKDINAKIDDKKTELAKLEKSPVIVPTSTSIKEGTVSKISPAVSLMGGYKATIDDFGFITEVGADVVFSSKIGSKSKNEIEVKKGASLYLSQKVGYEFIDNTLTYLTFGVSATKYKISHDQIKDVTKTLIQPMIGVGSEFAINENLSLFTEFNIHLAGKIKVKDIKNNELGDVKLSTQQFKIGARYYM